MDLSELAHRITYRAYELDGDDLDSLAGLCGLMSWHTLIAPLTFQEFGTEDGRTLLCAADESGLWITLTDGAAGVPTSPDTFQLSLAEDLLSEPVYTLDVVNGHVVQTAPGLN
ncbi:hypothetical protein [Deinococcus radiodurans]|jgi:hypothetical protein|uniref:Uncharacterized protein n=1 Tax=Deinococcus radiodurans (strain ATCC 13939 / DSM 20539 / JCM 16871 / CCUG 27074 / LMG 4051 / NBRC 15346 / NCIMB 9279 / VKM B-1422 / R1) TaxID=243230 RepID=Q9RZM7_DEIRA|nr:hypothetical protein [Deinococcus radiodurans]AAF12615.1 hypothetical protein DR_B0096 [Deinococcus radiodurans R1 = ATCC 13939 = DSM 20539]ANC73263.1 hypothetical protein A2G07_15575 [Deinococcus radiodurans R1 = ATCC 13939 = DSM 20539]QEM73253.1 hypothetical protein DXG80_15765 [Deinococcus radiodurans]QIP30646.1 hypothetical protein HAV23_15445 [Deinococcus radiodurans]QIP33526.1 hypothetical protein HAV35_15280 [Deinococcus radiodurans]